MQKKRNINAKAKERKQHANKMQNTCKQNDETKKRKRNADKCKAKCVQCVS